MCALWGKCLHFKCHHAAGFFAEFDTDEVNRLAQGFVLVRVASVFELLHAAGVVAFVLGDGFFCS